MKLHRDVLAIKREAPKRAKWLCVTLSGSVYWQPKRGGGLAWIYSYEKEHGTKLVAANDTPETKGLMHTPFAIDLTLGDVHLQDHAGKVTIVPHSAWVAARKRKAKR